MSCLQQLNHHIVLNQIEQHKGYIFSHASSVAQGLATSHGPPLWCRLKHLNNYIGWIVTKAGKDIHCLHRMNRLTWSASYLVI